MSDVQDKTNCIKNLIQLMCCDGRIASREKKFLFSAAKELGVQVEDWNALLKEVVREQPILYPIGDRDKAVSTLKAMVVMAKADRQLDEKEGELIRQFAKSIEITNSQWKQILKEIDVQSIFEPFQAADVSGSVLVLKEDFDRVNDFVDLAKEKSVRFRIAGLDEFMQEPQAKEDKVCFHAAPKKEATIQKSKQLLEKAGEKVVPVLTRYQGHQVQYLLECGIKKCIIEPVYERDLQKLFEKKSS